MDQSRTGALTGIIGARRAGTVSMISVLSRFECPGRLGEASVPPRWSPLATAQADPRKWRRRAAPRGPGGEGGAAL